MKLCAQVLNEMSFIFDFEVFNVLPLGTKTFVPNCIYIRVNLEKSVTLIQDRESISFMCQFMVV
jgi:hypothetical protein